MSRFLLVLLFLALVAVVPSRAELDPHTTFWGAQSISTDDLAADDSTDSALPLTSVSTRLGGSMTDLVDAALLPTLVPAAEPTPSVHRMKPMQAQGLIFNMTRRTAAAPFSHRIQPGLAFRTRPITYTQIDTLITIRLGAGYLLLYEGAMSGAYNGTAVVENDVWVSGDEGQSWDLIRGRSLFGRRGPVDAVNFNSFMGRRGSNNCGDPMSDILMSLGGVNMLTNVASTNSYHSFDGETWNLRGGTFAPGRHFSSCDIDESGHGFVIGGHTSNPAVPQDTLLNDVWVTSALWTYNPWRRITAAAPFATREEHLVLVASNTHLRGRPEVIYVIGGKVTCINSDCYDGMNANDVWISSDAAESWTLMTLRAPFGPRWGHGGWVNQDGALLMWGGLNSADGTYGSTVTWREMWLSLDGGYEWNLCPTPPNARFLRGEQGATVNANGQLILVGGYAYAEDNNFQVRYNDVWRSDFSVENTTTLAARCGVAIPAAGVGLRRWPTTTTIPANTMTFSPLTRRAPWSPRIQPALLLMSAPRTYINPTDMSVGTTGPDWLLMYEGSLTAGAGPTGNENDVYASVDQGRTWILISGIARLGTQGDKMSAFPDSSFRATSGAGNCEDPTSDAVYASGGQRSLNASYTDFSTETWYSSDAIHWTLRTGRSFSPGRYFHSCDVDYSGRVYIIGGRAPGGVLLNDVWVSTTMGESYTRVTAAAPFSGRYEHSVQIYHSTFYNRDLIYVSGGYVALGGANSTTNDVWVSSDAAQSWFRLSAAAPWGARWGHGVAMTEAGVMVVLGGTSSAAVSYNDLWASFDGGLTWHSCRLERNSTVIRGEQAVALTADEHLIVGQGYRYAGAYRVEYTDLYITDVSLNNSAALATMCSTTVPAAGVGLRMANWQQAAGSSSAAPRAASSSSTAALRRVSSSSSTAAGPVRRLCPSWAWGTYQPNCYCPDGIDGEYPDCMCPAKYGRNMYYPDDCMDLLPEDPDAPPAGTAGAAAASSGGISTATMAALIVVLVAVALIGLAAYFRYCRQAPSGMDSSSDGGSTLLGGSTAPLGSTGLDYYSAPATHTQPTGQS